MHKDLYFLPVWRHCFCILFHINLMSKDPFSKLQSSLRNTSELIWRSATHQKSTFLQAPCNGLIPCISGTFEVQRTLWKPILYKPGKSLFLGATPAQQIEANHLQDTRWLLIDQNGLSIAGSIQT